MPSAVMVIAFFQGEQAARHQLAVGGERKCSGAAVTSPPT
jgi:hypothetical protein